MFPAVDDLVGQTEGVDAGVVCLDVRPEHSGQFAYQASEGAVVDPGAAFFEVADEQVADLRGLDVVGVDQLGGGPLPVPQRVLEGILRVDDAGAPQQVPGAVGTHVCVTGLPPSDGPQVEDVLGGELSEVPARVQDDRGDDAQALVDVAGRHADLGTEVAHSVQLPGGEHLLDVLEEPHRLVAAQEDVARENHSADEKAVEAHHELVAPGLLAARIVRVQAQDQLFTPVRPGRKPSSLPPVFGEGQQPVEDLGRPREPDSSGPYAAAVRPLRPERRGRQQGQDLVSGEVVVRADAFLVRCEVVLDEQRLRRRGAGSGPADGIGPAASLSRHAWPPPNSTARSLAS